MRQQRTSRPGRTIAVLGYCGALVSISQTVALPLLPILPDELHTSAGNISWVATAAVLSGAIANPVMGRLGDMHGKRRMMVVSLNMMLFGSIIAALSPNVLVLVIGRAMQGFGIAVLPLGMSLAKAVLPPEKTSQGVALVSATLGIGGGIGLPLAGVLTGVFNWQSVFWVCAALTLLALAATLIWLPDDATSSTLRFDTTGAVWLSACLVAVLLPLSKTSSWGIFHPLPLALYALGFAGFVGWYRFEQGLELPLVNVTLMRQRSMMLVNGAGLLLGFAMFSNMYASLALLQTPKSVAHGFGLSVVVAGLVMAPGAVAMMLTSPLSAWITDHHGARTSLWLGAAVIGFGYATRQMMLGSLAAIALSVVIVNAGVGLAYGAMPSAIMSFVPDSETASANAIGTLTRATGASISGAMVGAVLTGMTISDGAHLIPSLGAFRLLFAASTAAAFGAAALAFRLPRTRLHAHVVAVMID